MSYPIIDINKDFHSFRSLLVHLTKMSALVDISTGDAAADQPSLPDKTDSELLSIEATRCLSLATRYAFDLINSDDHWCGEFRSNVTLTAEHVFFHQSLGLDLSVDGEAYRCYLFSQQNKDGSWSIAPDCPGCVSTTAEAYLALKILGVSDGVPEMCRAQRFVIEAGGLAKVRIFTRIFFAQFGLFPWDAVPQLPAEFILIPTQSPINIYRFSSWARSTIVPLLIIRHHQPIYALPNGVSAENDFLDKLWLDAGDKMVTYGPALSTTGTNDLVGFMFGAIDLGLYCLGGLRFSPLRGYARRQCVKWILERQEKTGDWAGITPPMHASVQALLLEGFGPEDPRVRRGIEAIERFAWQDRNGKRIQACLSPVWDTVLMTRALCDAGTDPNDGRLRRAVKWTKARQILGPEGDWRIYSPKLAPGGFAFEYHNTWYPDVDDTAAAILAFIKQSPQAVGSTSVARAAEWICGMQNSDGGWAAFDLINNKLFLNKIPFSDMNSLCDPSTPDITGRVLEAFGLIIHTAREEHVAPDLIDRVATASRGGIAYLAKTQELTGAWYGRWGVNYIYGTSNVLCGLAYFSKKDRLVQKLISPALHWLVQIQNPDGGWGEGLDSYQDEARAGCGPSTPSQTAWAIMALLAHISPTDQIVRSGIAHLVHSQTDIDGEGSSWPEKLYTATGFPGHFYIGYTLYRHYFPMMALGRYVEAMRLCTKG